MIGTTVRPPKALRMYLERVIPKPRALARLMSEARVREEAAWREGQRRAQRDVRELQQAIGADPRDVTWAEHHPVVE